MLSAPSWSGRLVAIATSLTGRRVIFMTPMRVVSDDPLERDLFFRYNQSLQEFVNASASFPTVFAE